MADPTFWSEWDGRGRPEAVAWTAGWIDADDPEALKNVRKLGVIAREIELTLGWVGYVDEDDIPDACTADGETLEMEDFYVSPESIIKATFASVVVQ